MSDEVFLQSGVKYRCACGSESGFAREAKLPPMWSVRWVVFDGRSWPLYRCDRCVGAGEEHHTEAQTLEEWREKARGRKKGKGRRR